jgi:hypothetical protein
MGGTYFCGKAPRNPCPVHKRLDLGDVECWVALIAVRKIEFNILSVVEDTEDKVWPLVAVFEFVAAWLL